MANEYLPWFAVECHFTPDQVYDMPWMAMVQLTFTADEQDEQARKAKTDAQLAQRPMRQLT